MIPLPHKGKTKIIHDLIQGIVNKSLKSVDPYNLIADHLRVEGDNLLIQGRPFALKDYNKIHVLGVGKGATFFFHALKEKLADRLSGGVVVSLGQHKFTDRQVLFCEGTHPIPDEKSLLCGRKIMGYARENIGKNDLVFFLITGGASALMVLPAADIGLEKKMAINRLLLNSGAEIKEINCVRKHLSAIKGGRLAEWLYPAKVISLILSDVVDSPLDAIGSGPTVADPSTFADAFFILKKYDLLDKIDSQIHLFLQKGIHGQWPDTPKKNSEIFLNHHYFLLGDNKLLLNTARQLAEQEGIKAHILTSGDHGEAVEVSKVYASVIKEIMKTNQPFPANVLLLMGGELTVTTRGKGKGGRNQEFVLGMLRELSDVNHPFYIASLGTDGIDGPTDAAGAWIDEKTVQKVRSAELDISLYLSNNDSYNFFKKIDQLILTGPTRTNVMDMRLVFVGEKGENHENLDQ